jgi:outer membrane protein TolC
MTRPDLARGALAALLLLAAPAARAAEAPAPLTLDEALSLAARQNHDLAIARADASIAGADTTASLQGLLPRLDLAATAGHQFFKPAALRADAVTGFITQQSDYEVYTVDLRLTQPLLDLGAWRRRTQAKASARAASLGNEETRLSVAYDVTRRFYEQVKAERSLSVLRKSAARSQELLDRSEALFAAGRAQKADVVAARVNLGNDLIAVQVAETRLVTARGDLALALGQPGDQGVAVVPPAALEGAPGAVEPPPVEVLLATARDRRPALAAAAAQVEAADATLGAARAGYWPTLGALASYSRSGAGFTGTNGVYDDPSKNYAAYLGLTLNWNFFAGRSTEAGVARAEAGSERARASAARTLDGAAGEVSGARQAVVALARQVAYASDNLGAAEQGLSLARQRLEAGLASQLEVRDATLKLTQAELSLLQARIDHAVAVANLARAVGGAI